MNLKLRFLWIHDIPGAGKTVLASHLIECIGKVCQSNPRKGKPVPHVYYYFYHARDQDETEHLLRWILDQLCCHLGKIPSPIYELYRQGQQPTISNLLFCVEEALEELETVFLVVDAVDESFPREKLLQVLHSFATEERFGKIQLLATSREYNDIHTMLADASAPLSISNPLVTHDIKKYVASILRSDKRFKSWPKTPRLVKKVEATLAKGVKGMFRWAVCQLEVLRRQRGVDGIRNALRDLPPTLDETYCRIFSSIEREDWTFLRHILRWIIFHNIIHWNDKTEEYDIEKYLAVTHILQSYSVCYKAEPMLYNRDALLEVCGCLITLTSDSSQDDGKSSQDDGNWNRDDGVQLAHYTVKEFLN
ncbi:hypothetical protein B0H63DRAFT_450203 [Podospora didyma]|uniref:Nephrocystin 3-like N-terminal domain-containing protein n=1 Tax=Podospora didyma TaxID=330526 RepID=A0AAE0NG22_9PEZI|nr:hypothetical protein B0H63DRAFT_450203 [Podospora didyma]